MADRSEENLPVPSGGGGAAPGAHHDHGIIYKSGEGYWVRVMTLAIVALITMASAAWVYKSLEVLSDKIPARAWNLVLRGYSGSAAAGDPVTLLSTKNSVEPEQVGTTSVIAQLSNVGGEMVVQVANPGALSSGTMEDLDKGLVRIGTQQQAQISGMQVVRAFDIEYVQIGAAAAVLLFGAVCGYWFVGRSPHTVEFLIATDAEMRKVNWSTRREILGSTYVVIGACFVVAVALFLIDYMFSEVFKAIDLLRLGN